MSFPPGKKKQNTASHRSAEVCSVSVALAISCAVRQPRETGAVGLRPQKKQREVTWRAVNRGYVFLFFRFLSLLLACFPYFVLSFFFGGGAMFVW